MAVINLGLVKAIFVGTSAPTNTDVVWRDTSVSPEAIKYYNTIQGQWIPLAGLGNEVISESNPIVTSGNYSPTGVISPGNYSTYLRVTINGYLVDVGSGVKTKDCYYSSDGGATAKNIYHIAIGDELIWNGEIGPTELLTTDIVKQHIL